VSDNANESLDRQIERIQNPRDLAAFVLNLNADLAQHPERWENRDLASYLEAMAAWLEDSNGRPDILGVTADPGAWRVVAEVLLAASMYE
jgi:hypothetical protein